MSTRASLLVSKKLLATLGCRCPLLLVASLLLVVRPGATSSFLVTTEIVGLASERPLKNPRGRKRFLSVGNGGTLCQESPRARLHLQPCVANVRTGFVKASKETRDRIPLDMKTQI